MTTKTLTVAAVALALMPTLGLAQDGPRGPMPHFDFDAADVDASGGVSYPEFTAYLQEQMQMRRDARLGARADRMLAAGDADGDGALTREELIAAGSALGEERRSQMRDRRGDGREMRAERGERNAMRQRDGEGRHGHDMGRNFDPERMANRLFDRIDRDNDGQISADEAQVAQERMQQRMEGRREHRRNG